MSNKDLQNFVRVDKYAKYIPEKKRRENWEETVERWVDGFCKKYPKREKLVRNIAKDFILPFKVMPSMRSLQFGGEALLKANARTFNCTASNIDRLSFFSHGFYLLLCGCGVGGSVQERHLSHLPNLSKARLSVRSLPTKVHVVEDSVEGWSDCAAIQLSSWFERPIPGFENFSDCEVIFDYSKIREKGSPLSHGVGLAPGPEGLARALVKNENFLQKMRDEKLTRFNDVYASDYFLTLSDAVVSGGIRRSAVIITFDATSQGMLEYKTGNWFSDENKKQRGRANISSVLERSSTSLDKFFSIIQSTKQFGEPGFYFTDNPDVVPNPCVEIGMYPYLNISPPDKIPDFSKYDGPIEKTDTGYRVSGFQGCNLTTINGSTVEDEGDFYARCEAASIIGTWQAGMTNMPYLGEISQRIFDKEALLGVSISGMLNKPEIFMSPDTLLEGSARVTNTNQFEAKVIGINQAARTTCIKPDGNSASFLGCFSGCHPGKIRKGFRIAQANRQSPPYKFLSSINPTMVEKSAWDQNDTDDVIRFPVSYDGILEDEMGPIKFLEFAKMVQEKWVMSGTNRLLCQTHSVNHNVSITVKVPDDMWDDVARYIYDNKEAFTGISLISHFGDRDFVQSPFTPVFSMEEIVEVNSCRAVDLCGQLFSHYKKMGSIEVWADLDRMIYDEGQNDLDILAKSYFYGDRKKASYLVKDLYNLMIYDKIVRSIKPVDYSLMREDKDVIDFQGEVACAGGACEVNNAALSRNLQ